MPSTTSKGQGEPHKTLRQLAAEKTQGKGANPSLLGDPVSLAAESTADDKPNTAKKAGSGKHGAASDHGQTRRDPADHDNGPSGSSGSVTKGRPSSKL
ncbi:hypothetical protein NKR19_g6446 [Coniochaeta hoffmannii]|uniref:Uncharacterized protein n=1 Tax=Coniochaeta hoffmannii TaxID=91930 RepID=A0AA38VQ03_9PEZI|nr:hypothetical protein NKR19_g6446 [Coniochaeta hoffmannii]